MIAGLIFDMLPTWTSNLDLSIMNSKHRQINGNWIGQSTSQYCPRSRNHHDTQHPYCISQSHLQQVRVAVSPMFNDAIHNDTMTPRTIGLAAHTPSNDRKQLDTCTTWASTDTNLTSASLIINNDKRSKSSIAFVNSHALARKLWLGLEVGVWLVLHRERDHHPNHHPGQETFPQAHRWFDLLWTGGTLTALRLRHLWLQAWLQVWHF